MGSPDTGSSADRGRHARLLAIEVADDPGPWERAGFVVVDGRARVGTTDIVLVGEGTGHQGIVGWTLAGLPPSGTGDRARAPGDEHRHADTLDGLPTTFATSCADSDLDPDAGAERGQAHRNGIVGLDHVVVATPDLARTTAALAAIGIGCRRVRETTAGGTPMRQAFFWLGPTVLEVISGTADSGETAKDAPATWFGLALDAADLDVTAAALGDGLGPIRDAVQDGRRIATLRHRPLGLSVAVAVMDDHAGR